MTMTFNELLQRVSSEKRPNIRIDSRHVRPGDIFVALAGTACDGHDFIEHARAAGASFIVAERNTDDNPDVICVRDSAIAAAILVQASCANPARELTNLAVTGTNGKTTVAYLVRSIIKTAGHNCGLLGSIIYDTGSQITRADLTTPDSITIAQKQQQMLQAGAKYMVIEASSHALAQNRLAAVSFKAAAFTNLSGDHLDYHKTTENYLAAKAKLFQGLPSHATAVLNKQSPAAAKIASTTGAKILWYSTDAAADITADVSSMDINGTNFKLCYQHQKQPVSFPLPGRYNLSNALAAAGLALAAGFDFKTIAGGLGAVKTIPGRLEKIDHSGPHILIDYAHTDDALKNVLMTLRPLCRANLILVFGCGGDRDKTKRPRMARVAEEYADSVIVTSDNPRTEEAENIINDILAGFEKPNAPTIKAEPDRKKAIRHALNAAAPNDTVLIAGKGHENYQIIGSRKLPFSDKKIVQQCLARQI